MLSRAFWLVAAAVVGCVFIDGAPAGAESAGEVRAAAREISTEIGSQKSAGRFDVAAQQRAVDRLGKLALACIDLSDRAANAGGEDREREALLSTYQAVSG